MTELITAEDVHAAPAVPVGRHNVCVSTTEVSAAPHARARTGGAVLGVVSGCGGAGGSVFAAVLAGCAARSEAVDPGAAAPVFLLDCDPMGGGIDVLLGCEQVAGPRWSHVRLQGGVLDPGVLVDTLPRWQHVSFLAADSATALQPDAVAQLIEVASSVGTVVVDLPRWASPARTASLGRCDRVVLVTPAEIRAVTSSALVASALDPSSARIAVRGSYRSLPAGRISEILGLPLLGELPYDPASLRPGGLDVTKIRRRTRRVAREALADLGATRLNR
jgi:secretion/DNA translocation related CpaE-like protein